MKNLLFSVTIKDCKVDTFRAGGKGGQAQNKLETGVRITHIASGAVGEARDGRSQHTNKRNAFFRMARSRIFQDWLKSQNNKLLGVVEIEKHRNVQRGFGSRYVRTYDFPDQMVKDPVTGHTRHDIENVMDGDLDSFIKARVDLKL